MVGNGKEKIKKVLLGNKEYNYEINENDEEVLTEDWKSRR